MYFSANKDINKFIKQLLKEQNITFKRGQKHDFLIINNRKIAIPCTPSHIRSLAEFKSQIRRIYRFS